MAKAGILGTGEPVNVAAECCAPSPAVSSSSSQLAAAVAGPDVLRVARGFSALGDPVRLQILSMLACSPDGEICVCNFVGPLGKTQGTVSHHLKILVEAGLIRGERRGKWVWYSLDRAGLADLQAVLSV
jgi:ArsR family transcriptional regulator